MKLEHLLTRRFFFAWFTTVVLVGAAGCRKDVTQAAMESDANGYVCRQNHKFYTDRSIFADKCPQCGTIELFEVYGYVCEVKPLNPQHAPGCGHVTLAARGGSKAGASQCEKCKRPVAAIKLPSAKELAAWSAIKATREQVSVPK